MAVPIPDRASSGLPALLREHRAVGLAVLLAALTTLNALTEGAGLVLLVPMLAALGAGGGAGGWIGHALERVGLDADLETLLLLFVALVILRAVLGAARDLAGLLLQTRVIDGLRLRAWRALVHCDWRVLSTMRQSDAASMLITNVDRVGTGLHHVIALTTGSATLVSIGLAALAIAPHLALGAAAAGAVVLLAYRRLRRRAAELGGQLGKAYGDIHGQLSEGLGALRVIKSLGSEDASTRRIASVFAALRRAEFSFTRDTGLARVAFQTAGAVLLAVLVWLAIRRWGLGPAAVLPAVALFARALPLLGVVQENWQKWAHVRPALLEAEALIARAEAAAEATHGADERAPLPGGPAVIALDGVTVRHAGREAASLEHVSLALAPGSVTALSGPSGSGKSTLADVLCGLIGPDCGTLTVGGVTVAGTTRRAWRERVAYVQQEPVLVHASLRDNLRWGAPDADDAALAEALRAASADFVADLPEGLDTVVGDRGSRLSGGERQRVALARGLLRAPDLLILDEVTSALDPANEAAICAAIARLKGRLTIVIIGHRGALSELADRRVALDGGRLVPEELAARG